MKAGLEKRIETLEEKANPPDTEMDLIARLVKYERIFRDCEIDVSSDPEIAKLDEEYKSLMTPEIEEKLELYESLFEQPVDEVQSEKSEDSEAKPDSPQNVDEKLAVKPVEPLSEPELISGPPDGWLRRDVFKKELVKDGDGNWFWRTVVDLSELELPQKIDPAYEAALGGS